MEQVAHQAVVMQFILEMASNSQQDPRGCFREFFHKAKVSRKQRRILNIVHLLAQCCIYHAGWLSRGFHKTLSFLPFFLYNSILNNNICVVALQEGQDVYLEVFRAELEAFKQRVKEYVAKCRNDALNADQQNDGPNYRPNTKVTTDIISQASTAVFSWVSLNLVACSSYLVQLIDGTKNPLFLIWYQCRQLNNLRIFFSKQ